MSACNCHVRLGHHSIHRSAAESRSETRGSQEFSFRKVLVSKDPEFDPQNPCEKLGVMVCASNSSTGEAETRKDT